MYNITVYPSSNVNSNAKSKMGRAVWSPVVWEPKQQNMF